MMAPLRFGFVSTHSAPRRAGKPPKERIMSSRHLVDPELAPAIEHLPTEAFTLENLQARRDWMASAFNRGGGVPPAPGIVRSEAFAPGLNGAPDVRLLIYAHE